MGAYQYVALDEVGKEYKGTLEGETPKAVRQVLRERKLFPVEVVETRTKENITHQKLVIRKSVSALDLALFTRQLATLVRAGLPLDEALQAVSEQSEKAHVKGVALGVKAKVLSGHTLAESLNDFRKIFPAVYRATVAAGEQSGRLDTILDRLAEYTESRHSLRQKVNHALIYPVVLTGLSLTIIVLMLVYVVPKVVGVFQTSGQSLPILTRSLIWFSDFLQNWWLGILGVLGILIFTIHRSLENEETKKRAHRWILKIPVLGKVSRGLNTARFTRTFSILNSSGVPVLESLRISASVVSNLPMRDAVEKATMRVREGSAIGHALNESGIFPAMSIHLISSGETSGELDGMLEKAATHQEKEMDSTLTTMLNLLEPILIIFMGLIVLAIVMAVLLPIFQINQLIL